MIWYITNQINIICIKYNEHEQWYFTHIIVWNYSNLWLITSLQIKTTLVVFINNRFLSDMKILFLVHATYVETYLRSKIMCNIAVYHTKGVLFVLQGRLLSGVYPQSWHIEKLYRGGHSLSSRSKFKRGRCHPLIYKSAISRSTSDPIWGCRLEGRLEYISLSYYNITLDL